MREAIVALLCALGQSVLGAEVHGRAVLHFKWAKGREEINAGA